MDALGGISVFKSTASAVRLLVALHVAAAIAVTPFIEPHAYRPPAVSFLAFCFAQAGLVGMLAALGTQPLPVRLVETAAGILYLWALAICTLPNEALEFCELLTTSTLVAARVLGVMRHRGRGLCRPVAAAADYSGPLQFGIRHLLAVTLATAALLTIAPAVGRNGTAAILLSYGLGFAAVAAAAALGSAWLQTPIYSRHDLRSWGSVGGHRGANCSRFQIHRTSGFLVIRYGPRRRDTAGLFGPVAPHRFAPGPGRNRQNRSAGLKPNVPSPLRVGPCPTATTALLRPLGDL